MARNSSSTVNNNNNTEREKLIAAILANTQSNDEGPALTDRVLVAVNDAAATSLDVFAGIAGAVTGAWGNAQQVYTLERNFRAQERLARQRKLAERYADRLARLI